jgi:hypothetical protein
MEIQERNRGKSQKAERGGEGKEIHTEEEKLGEKIGGERHTVAGKRGNKKELGRYKNREAEGREMLETRGKTEERERDSMYMRG